jgi:hypothetical protein
MSRVETATLATAAVFTRGIKRLITNEISYSRTIFLKKLEQYSYVACASAAELQDYPKYSRRKSWLAGGPASTKRPIYNKASINDDNAQGKKSIPPAKLPSMKPQSPPHHSPHSPGEASGLHHKGGSAKEIYGVGAHAVSGHTAAIHSAKTPGVNKGLSRSNCPTPRQPLAQTIPNPTVHQVRLPQ